MDPTLILILLGAFSGLASGFLAGLLGIGGGVIIVPLLYISFHLTSFPPDVLMKFAIGTALASAVVATGVSSFVHFKKKTILVNYLKALIPSLVLGSISGVFLASYISDDVLRKLFGCLSLIVGSYFVLPRQKIHLGNRPNWILVFAGFIIGHLSSLLGVGGGIFTLPLLFTYPIQHTQASATSSVSTFITSLCGTCFYLLLPSHHPEVAYSIGWINLPSFVAISVASLFSVHFGVFAGSYLPADKIRKIFGICLILTGIEFLF